LPTLQDGYKTWYFLTVDYAFGRNLERDATTVVRANGGEVVGAVRHPYGTTDFASYLLQAKESGAQVIGFADSGQDMENAVKQAREFELPMRRVPLLALIMDVYSVGLDGLQGARFSEPYYWDLDEPSRAWAKRFFAAEQHMPTSLQVDAYRAVMHYLKAIKATGTTDAGPVMQEMKKSRIHDVLGDGGYVREDGRVIRDLHYFEVKSPAESKYPWDYYKLIRNIPADQIYRPLSESECPLVKK
jgi:branched-chain amino acid transport system substrate-binding protein